MLEKLLKIHSMELLKHLASMHDSPTTDGKNYVYYPSASSLMLVSHVDTVRREDKPLEILREGNVISARDSVLGADDRAGVWAMMKIAPLCRESGLEVPSLLFTNFEERGGRGMLRFISDYGSRHFRHIHLVAALDRARCDEYVTYNDLPAEVSRYVESFGFKRTEGIFSDIAYFTDKFRIPSINLSVGYYKAHTVHERWHVDETRKTIDKVLNMIRNPIQSLYKTARRNSQGDYYGRADIQQKLKRRFSTIEKGRNKNTSEIMESVIR